MARSTGLVLAAGLLAAANETVLAPAAHSSDGGTGEGTATDWQGFNWRLVPATLVLAVLLAGFEQVAPDFAVGLGGLTLAVVAVTPTGTGASAGSPLENLARFVNNTPSPGPLTGVSKAKADT